MNADVGRVMINISGPGMPPIVCAYESNRAQGVGPCKFNYPDILVENVPAGSDRLIQVLVAYENESTGTLSFSYGDERKSLNSGANTSDIVLSDVSGSGQGGRMWARFLTGTNSGPTGMMEMRARPRADRPPMIIGRAEMLDGYFSAFVLEFLPLEYVVNGQNVFGKPITKVDLLAMPPALVSVENFSDGFEVHAFLGASSFTAGKFTNDDGACTSGEFVNCFKSTSRFLGPFVESSGNFLTVAGTVYSWEFLPAFSTADSRVEVFRILDTEDPNVANGFIRDEGLFDCGFLKRNPGLAESLGVVTYPTKSFDVTSAAGPTEAYAFCPVSGTGYFAGALTDPEIGFGGGGGGNENPYVRMEVVSGPTQDRVANECVEIKLKVFAPGGGNPAPAYPVPPPNALNIALADNLSGSVYSTLADCAIASSDLPGATIPVGSSETPSMWLRWPSSSFTITPLDLGINLAGQFDVGHGSNEVFTSGSASLDLEFPPQMLNTNQCYRLNVARRRPSGMPYNAAVDADVTVSTVSSVIHSDGTCTSPSPSQVVTLVSSNAIQSVWVKPTSAGTLALQLVAPGYTGKTVNFNVVNGSIEARRLVIAALRPPVAGECTPFRVTLVNSLGAPVHAPLAMTVGLDVAGSLGRAYNDPACNTGISSLSIPQGEFAKDFFVKAVGLQPISVSNPQGSPQISIIAQSGALTNLDQAGQGTPFQFPLPPPDSFEPSILMSAPNIRSSRIGSHELPIKIKFWTPNFTSLICETSPNTPCPLTVWDPVNRELTYSTHAQLVQSYEFKAVKNYRQVNRFFTLSQLYPQLIIQNCDQVVSPADPALQVLLATATSGNVICLSSGAVPLSTTLTIPSINLEIIGKLNQVGLDWTGRSTQFTSNGDFSIFTLNYPALFRVSNIDFQMNDPGGASVWSSRAAIVSGTGSGNLDVYSAYNRYFVQASTHPRSGVLLDSGEGVFDSMGDTYEVVSNATAGANTPIGIQSGDGHFVEVQRARFVLRVAEVTAGQFNGRMPPTAIYSSLNFNNKSIYVGQSAILGRGTAFRMNAGSGGGRPTLTVAGSIIDLLAVVEGNASRNRYVLKTQGNHSIQFNGNRIITDIADNEPFLLPSDSYTTPAGRQVSMTANVFVQRRDRALFSIPDPSAYNDDLQLKLMDNHFVRMVGGAASAKMIASTLGANLLSLQRNSPGDPPDGRNRFCADVAARQWAGAYSGATLGDNGEPLTLPSPGAFTVGVVPLAFTCQ